MTRRALSLLRLLGPLRFMRALSSGDVKRSLRTVCAWMTLVLVGLALPVAAQDRGADLSVGYQYQFVPAGEIPVGFSVDVSVPFGRVMNLVGQFDWSRKSEAAIQATSSQTVSMFSGGIRASRYGSRTKPFLQLLAGVTRNSFRTTYSTINTPQLAGRTFNRGGTMATVQMGGGLAVSLNGRVSAVGELDFRPYIHRWDIWSPSFRAVVGVRISL